MILLIISSLSFVNHKYEGDIVSDFKIFNNILKKFCIFHDDNHEDLNLYLSKLLLIQRDFKQGFSNRQESITTAYNVFEGSLSEESSETTEIKKSFRKIFRERDYMVCSTPVLEENTENNLIFDLGMKVTEDFHQELNKIRDKLVYQVKPKSVFNIVLKPKMMGHFIKELVKEINDCLLNEKIPPRMVLISKVWKSAEEAMFGEAMHEACDLYYEDLQKFFNEDKPRKRGILFKLLSSMREEV